MGWLGLPWLGFPGPGPFPPRFSQWGLTSGDAELLAPEVADSRALPKLNKVSSRTRCARTRRSPALCSDARVCRGRVRAQLEIFSNHGGSVGMGLVADKDALKLIQQADVTTM